MIARRCDDRSKTVDQACERFYFTFLKERETNRRETVFFSSVLFLSVLLLKGKVIFTHN
jgi:hypothetical protein